MTPSVDKPKAEATVGSRLGVIFGAALAVVVVVFLFNSLGNGASSGPPPGMTSTAPAQRPTSNTELPEGIGDGLEAIHQAADALEGADRVAKLREGVDLLLTVGRYDRAAQEQEAIAELTGSEDDWVQAGNHYYDWMEMTGGPDATMFAQKAIAAYQRVLEINPDNLDARADMAWAYMSDPENPMQGIQENTAVLEADSLHIRANFNRGRMLLQIGREAQALEQFRKLQRIVGDPSDRLYQSAGELIRTIEGG